MNHVAHIDLIRIRQAELGQAAEHHRLMAAVRGTAGPRRRGRTRLPARTTRLSPRRLRGVAEAEPCPP